MKIVDQRKAAKEFAERWKDKGYEKGESQKYWIDLLENVLGVDNVVEFIEFEDTVHIDKATGFIDGYIPSTKILIEQKSVDKDLRKPIKQSDGSLYHIPAPKEKSSFSTKNPGGHGPPGFFCVPLILIPF